MRKIIIAVDDDNKHVLAIPVGTFTGYVECGLCGNPSADWEIRASDYSEFLCDACYEKMAPYFDSFQGEIMLNHMLGNVV